MNVELMQPATMKDELTKLATEIIAHVATGTEFRRKSLDHYREAGVKLLQAREKLWAGNGRKGWCAWVKENKGLPTMAIVNKYIAVAKNWHLFENDTNFTLTAAEARIKAANGDTKTTDDEEAQDGTEANEADREATQAASNSDSSDGNKPKRTNKLGNTAYSPFFDGDEWKVAVEASEDGVSLLLPLRSETAEAKPLIKLAKTEARQLAALLANLV